MKAFKPKGGHGPEWYIQQAIIRRLTLEGWYVKPTHGNMYQSGFPDLFACHRSYGTKWIECKNPVSYKFTDAQIRDFTKMAAEGVAIYVLTSDSDDEIKKLFGTSNWYLYLSVYCK